MKTAAYGSLGSPGTFDVSPTHEYYWLLRDAYENCVTRYNLDAAEIAITQPESTDFTDLQTDVDTFRGSIKTWLADLPNIDDGSDPGTRGLPAVPGATWTSIIQKVVALAVGGAAGAVPAILLDLGIDVGLEIFSKWLAGKVYPGGDGSLHEMTKILRKALLIDPGILDFERSVFVGEKGGTGFWGLAQGNFASLGQMVLQALYKDSEDLDSSVFRVKDSGNNVLGIAETLFVGLLDSLTDGEETTNESLLARLMDGFELQVMVQGTPVKVSFQGFSEDN